MELRRALLQIVDRRKQERRQPIAVLSVADADALLLAERYTGPVTVMYASGVRKELHLPLAPLRILLDRRETVDKSEDAPDSH